MPFLSFVKILWKSSINSSKDLSADLFGVLPNSLKRTSHCLGNNGLCYKAGNFPASARRYIG